MDDDQNLGKTRPGFFAAWMLLHEKADDWLKDAIARAENTPEEARRDYQAFLLTANSEKETLKALFADAMLHEIKAMGFVHEDEIKKQGEQTEKLVKRLEGVEEKLERLGSRG